MKWKTSLSVASLRISAVTSSARDAMMLNYRTSMVSDGCATSSEEEHGNTLITFYTSFGDVKNTDKLCSRLEASNRRNVTS